MKKYLKCIVTMTNGSTFENPLKLGEAYLISQLAQQNKKVLVTLEITSAKHYNSMFG